MPILHYLIILFLLMVVIIMASFITHKTNALFIYIRAMILTVIMLIAGSLLFIDLFM